MGGNISICLYSAYAMCNMVTYLATYLAFTPCNPFILQARRKPHQIAHEIKQSTKD